MCVAVNHINLDEALAIIMNTKEYAEFEEMAHWMDVRSLYDYLSEHKGFRNSNINLQNFYSYLQNNVINDLQTTDDLIAQFMKETSNNNELLQAQLLQNAENKNNGIISTETQNLNERHINTIYFKLYRNGIDALNEDDKSELETLAKQCPMVGGTAVYKARSLWAMFEPTMLYDDIKLCNAIGLNKNNSGGTNDGLFTQENNYLQNLQAQQTKEKSTINNIFSVYPNPTTSALTIDYQLLSNQQGEFVIYDVLGRLRIKTSLINKNTHSNINTSTLELGIYTYKFIINKQQQEAGKLIIK
jgi:hypothetical protein